MWRRLQHRSGGGGVLHSLTRSVGVPEFVALTGGCGRTSWRVDSTEGRAACGRTVVRVFQSEHYTRSRADEGSGRQAPSLSVPPTIGRSVSRDHTSFVRVVWRRRRRRRRRRAKRLVWSPRAPPSLFSLSPLPPSLIPGTKRKMDRRFQQSRRKEHKKRTSKGEVEGSQCKWGTNYGIQEIWILISAQGILINNAISAQGILIDNGTSAYGIPGLM